MDAPMRLARRQAPMPSVPQHSLSLFGSTGSAVPSGSSSAPQAQQGPVPIKLFGLDGPAKGSAEMLRHESGGTTSASGGGMTPKSSAKDSLDASQEHIAPAPPEDEIAPPHHGADDHEEIPIFRCSQCGEIVAGDQLDEHVKVCPDPDHSHFEGSSPGSRSPTEEAVSPLGVRAGFVSERLLNEAASPEMTLSGSGLPVLSEDSKDESHARRHEQIREGHDQKRRSLQEELGRREAQECTFRPKINTGKHMAKERPDFIEQVRLKENQRKKKLRDLESDMYREATHRPKISRFAEAWSERRSEDELSQGASQAVFDRLYAMSRQRSRQIEDSAGVSPRLTRGLLNDLPPPMDEDLTFQPQLCRSGGFKSRRSAPTAELLYIDAQDRQQRHRVNEAHRDELIDSERRAACQILPKSRQYYWQMLEKQVRQAFEEAAGGEDTLSYLYLETFLVKLGCVQHPKTSEHDPHTTETSRRLRLALWRHLDPDRKGNVDLLTLTVFFHILMGAVDDPNMSPANATPERCAMTDTARTGAATGSSGKRTKDTTGKAGSGADRVAPDVMGMDLEAIMEEGEDETVGEDGSSHGSPVHPHGGARIDPKAECPPSKAGGDSVRGDNAVVHVPLGRAGADEESQRIAELLARFHPARLRNEFRTLYLNRLHFSSGRNVRDRELDSNGSTEEVLAPEIDRTSRVLAEKVCSKQREEAQSEGNAVLSHEELMLWRREKTLQKQQAQKAALKKKETENCTFRPNTSGSALSRKAQSVVQVDMCSKHDELYAKALAQQERQREMIKNGEEYHMSREMAPCTFRPDIEESQRSYKDTRFHQQSADGQRLPTPRGFQQGVERLRRGFEEKEIRRQQLEGNPYDAMAARDLQSSSSDKKKKPFRLRTDERAGRMQRQPWEYDDPEEFAPPYRISPDRSGGDSPSSVRQRQATESGGSLSARGEQGSRSTSDPAMSTGRANDLGVLIPLSPKGRTLGPPKSPRGAASTEGMEGMLELFFDTQIDNAQPDHFKAGVIDAFRSLGVQEATLAKLAVRRQGSGVVQILGQMAALQEVQSMPLHSIKVMGYAAFCSREDLELDREAKGSPGAESEVLLFVDVSISPGNARRLTVYKGQSAAEAAADFASKFALSEHLAHKLHYLLSMQMQQLRGASQVEQQQAMIGAP